MIGEAEILIIKLEDFVHVPRLELWCQSSLPFSNELLDRRVGCHCEGFG